MKIPTLDKSFLWFSLFKECVAGLRYHAVSLVVFFLLFLFPFFSFAQFPYNESFRGLEAPGVIFGGTPTALLTAGKSLDTAKTNDIDGEGYLRLTNNLGDQTGYIYSNAVFPGTYGLHIEFDYFTRGGSGADGISFFLFDASVPNFTIGAFGGSLGYAQKLINNGNTKLNGVSKGYLGIGLDEYGNFSSEDEGRNSGLLKAKLSPDRVVLRGAGNGYNTDPNNYKYLTSAPTNTGTNAFKIAGGKRGAVAGDPEYRRVIINLEPRVGGGLVINVSIKHGNIVTPLIVNEPYATAVPAAGLKYGIASSTGGATNYHEIRGLEITVDPTKLATPVANNDIVNICQDYTVTTSKDIFANDDLKNAGGKANKEKVDLDPNTDGIYEQTIVQPGIGTFFFNQATMLLEFKPDPAFNSTTSISYNFLDVYGAKSTTATVTVNTVLPKVTKQPVINPVCENGSFSTSVEGDGGSGQLRYQWQFSSDGKAPENPTKTWTNISGNSTAQTATLSVNNVVIGQDGWYYRVLLTSNAQGVTCPAYSAPARLVVNPLPTAAISTAAPVCPGSPDVALTFTGSKGTAPYTFTYTINNGTPQTVTSATGSNTVNVYQSAVVSGDFVYKITSISDASSTSCSVAQAENSTITVRPPATKPTITAGSREFCEGTALSISSSAVENNQWYKNGILIPGADKKSYTVIDAGSYTVLYTNEFGCSTFSDPKEIVVNPRPADPVLTSPSNSYCQNGSVIITSSLAYTYKWYKDGDPILVGGLPYNQRTYNVTEPGNYSVIAVSEKGCQSDPSNTLIISENPLPAAPTFSASATSFCAGSSVVLTSSSATGNQWYKNDVLITGATDAKYIVTEAGSYKVVFTNGSGCSASSASTDITLIPDPTIILTSDGSTISQVVCRNTNITEITYAVTNATGVTVSGLPSTFTSSFNSATKVFTINGSAAVAGEYSYTVSTTGGCTIASLSGKITVSPDASIVLTSGNANPSVCVNTGINEIKYTISDAVSYTITPLPRGVYSDISGGIISIKGNPNDVGDFPYTITTTGGCYSATASGTITSKALATVNKPGSQTLCNDKNTDVVEFSSNVAGTTYNWVNNNRSIGLADSGIGNIGSFKAVNISNSPVTATITVTPVSGTGCVAGSETFTITVNPTAKLTKPIDQVKCNGSTTDPVLFNGPVSGTTYSWIIDHPEIGLTAGAGSEIVAFTAVNTTKLPIVARITVTPSANGCPGKEEFFEITVNPTPTVEEPASFEVCNDVTTASIIFSQVVGKEVSGTTFSWTIDHPEIGLNAGAGSGIAGFKAVNTSNTPIIATITVTPIATGCPGAPETFTITVNPIPTVVPPASFEICNDGTTTPVIFTQVAGKEVSGTTFSWTNDKPGIGLAESGTGNIADFKAVNLTNEPIIATITVIPTATSCPGEAKTFTITVNPTPTVTAPSSFEVCNDATTTSVTFVQVAGKEVTGTTFNWTNDKPGIGLAGSGTGNIAGFKAINLTNAPIIATITVIPTATGCPGEAKTFTITVNPTPTVAVPASFEVCNEVATSPVIFTEIVGKEVAGTTFSWTNDKPGIGIVGSGTGNIAGFNAINLTNTPIVATITVIPTATGCPG
ncbi:PKD-like domain-containing protein, partial [Pedobacter sp. MR2016-24]|uniref:PKD-like domain-containing protein n=1 Tax=Pedobacter sp. MR2016-24 TaxID=2994466 RepID=UPI002AFF2D9B